MKHSRFLRHRDRSLRKFVCLQAEVVSPLQRPIFKSWQYYWSGVLMDVSSLENREQIF